MIVNRVILIGNLGADPEVRVLETGVKMARFSMATNETFTLADGSLGTHTEWHSIVAWRTVADYVQRNLGRGSLVRIEGKIRSRKINDPATKAIESIYEIVADSVQLLVNDAITTSVEKIDPVERPAQFVPLDVDNLPF